MVHVDVFTMEIVSTEFVYNSFLCTESLLKVSDAFVLSNDFNEQLRRIRQTRTEYLMNLFACINYTVRGLLFVFVLFICMATNVGYNCKVIKSIQQMIFEYIAVPFIH